MTKLKFKTGIFKSPNKFVFYKCFYFFFFIYIKMSKTLSAKYYQENKKNYKKSS